MTQLRLGMIGCGLIARAHGLAAAKSRRDIHFTACSNRSAEPAQAFAGEFGCDYWGTDHKALLAENRLDGIVIATPPDSHAAIIQDALDAGLRFILCEKPLTMNASEALAVRAAAKRVGATVIEGFMYRYHPQISKLVELIASRELGLVDQIHCVVNMLDASEASDATLPPSWRRAQSTGGVLHDFLCYPIDLANLLMQQLPIRATARTFHSPRHATPYRSFGTLEYENGTIASIGASRLSDFAQPLIVGCAKGTVRIKTAFNPIGSTEIVVQESTSLIGLRETTIPVEMAEPESDRLLDLPVFVSQLEHFFELVEGTARPAIKLDESVRNAYSRDAYIAAGTTGMAVPVGTDT